MTFKIVLSNSAQIDLVEAADYIALDSSTEATKWLREALEEIRSLQEMPLRFSFAPEAEEVGRSIRQMPFHSHRVVYWVDDVEAVVYIVRVYHMARRPLTSQDFDPKN